LSSDSEDYRTYTINLPVPVYTNYEDVKGDKIWKGVVCGTYVPLKVTGNSAIP